MLPGLILNDTVKAKLVSVPYFTEVSLLYYRSDLLQKYQFTRPPRTWSELEHQGRTIQDGERANGNTLFWGFLWQGAASEALTCNALEWQISQSGGRLIGTDGKPRIRCDRFVAALERAREWIGTLFTARCDQPSLRRFSSDMEKRRSCIHPQLAICLP